MSDILQLISSLFLLHIFSLILKNDNFLCWYLWSFFWFKSLFACLFKNNKSHTLGWTVWLVVFFRDLYFYWKVSLICNCMFLFYQFCPFFSRLKTFSSYIFWFFLLYYLSEKYLWMWSLFINSKMTVMVYHIAF